MGVRVRFNLDRVRSLIREMDEHDTVSVEFDTGDYDWLLGALFAHKMLVAKDHLADTTNVPFERLEANWHRFEETLQFYLEAFECVLTEATSIEPQVPIDVKDGEVDVYVERQSDSDRALLIDPYSNQRDGMELP